MMTRFVAFTALVPSSCQSNSTSTLEPVMHSTNPICPLRCWFDLLECTRTELPSGEFSMGISSVYICDLSLLMRALPVSMHGVGSLCGAGGVSHGLAPCNRSAASGPFVSSVATGGGLQGS